jgi:hypothetical protein
MRNRTLRGPVRKILQKLADFADALYNSLIGPTARGVIREVESGRALKREMARFEETDAKSFAVARDKSKRSQYFTKLTKKQEKEARFYKLPGHDVGYGILPDGEIVNIFNNSKVGTLGTLAAIDAIGNGGKSLTAYDGHLGRLYESLGFRIKQIAPWDPNLAPSGWEGPGRNVLTMEFEGGAYDSYIIAGSYEAAWNRRLGADGPAAAILNAVHGRFDREARGGLVPGERERAEKRVRDYLSRTVKNYDKGVNETAPLTNILPFKNILVQKKKAKSNKGRTLLVQVTSNKLREEATSIGDYYFDALYSKRDGYERPADFWEVPEWIGRASKTFPNSDVYVVRNIEEAKQFLDIAGYDNVMFSVMDSNKDLVLRIIENYNGDVSLGGYVDPAYFQRFKRADYHNSLERAAKALGLPYKPGVDYSHFKDSTTVPRLELSKGCLHKCAFCTVPKKIETQDDKSIKEQVKSFADLKYKLIYLNDKTFGQAKNYLQLKDIYQEIKKQNPAFQGFIVQTTAPSLLKMTDGFLQSSGIKFVELGVETYNDDILRRLSKPHSTKQIDQAVAHLRTCEHLFPGCL